MQQLKAYMSLEGYKYFVDGWVNKVVVWSVKSQSKACVVYGTVKHSQRLSASPLEAWAAVERDGLVICAHCNCMAGLGEACSHVAAVFLLEANTQQKKNLSCTSQPCYWLPPTFKNVRFAQICDIDFTSAPTKFLSDSAACPSKSTSTSTTSMTPSSSEHDTFYKNLSKVGKKPVILSLVPGFCDAYVPLQSKGNFPTPLMELHQVEYLSLSYPDLLTKCGPNI